MKSVMLAAFLALPIMASADPAPFGLEIGKATIKDVKEKYGTQRIGINKYSNGEMYDLDVSSINFDGLQKATVVFSQDGKLLAVLAILPKGKFDYLLNSLSGKYKVVSKNIPFVGDKSAKLIDGDTEITLDSPHLSFDMEMSYIKNDLLRSYKDQSSQEKKRSRIASNRSYSKKTISDISTQLKIVAVLGDVVADGQKSIFSLSALR